MNHHYADIRDRIDEPPTWWDENAVPRYGEFHPDATANIYAREVALVGIRCQNCGTPFKVAFSYAPWPDRKPLSESIADLHYGDPPNAGCCPAGPTMNSEPVLVLEFWTRQDQPWEWRRVSEYERPIDCDWTDAEPWDEDAASTNALPPTRSSG